MTAIIILATTAILAYMLYKFTRESNTLKLLKILDKHWDADISYVLNTLKIDKSNLKSTAQRLNDHIWSHVVCVIKDRVKLKNVSLRSLYVTRTKRWYNITSNNNNAKRKIRVDYPYEVYREGFIVRFVYNLFWIN